MLITPDSQQQSEFKSPWDLKNNPLSLISAAASCAWKQCQQRNGKGPFHDLLFTKVYVIFTPVTCFCLLEKMQNFQVINSNAANENFTTGYVHIIYNNKKQPVFKGKTGYN